MTANIFLLFWSLRKLWITGREKARVLPVPVGAVTRVFLYSMRDGIACI